MKEDIQTLMEKYQRELQAILTKQPALPQLAFPVIDWAHNLVDVQQQQQHVELPSIDRNYVFKKLPRWGQDAEEHVVEFEWPSALLKCLIPDFELCFDPTQPHVSLASIQFKDCEGCISSVQCTLTNGQQSPVFEKVDQEYENTQSISLDPQTPIRAVRAYQGKGQRRGYLYRMSFIDGKVKHLQQDQVWMAMVMKLTACLLSPYCYNPDNDQDDQTEYRLAIYSFDRQ